MSMLRQGAAVLAMFSIALSSLACSSSAPVSRADKEPVVALAQGVMASLGSLTNRGPSPRSNFRIDPDSGREIYLPTGESVDDVIPVRARRDDRALSLRRAASASSERARMCLPDGGSNARTPRDAGRSAT